MVEFRQVPGFEAYSVSEGATLINSSGHIMAKRLNDRTGYLSFSVRKSGRSKKLLVHRAVAFAWIGPPPEGKTCVAHLDGVKTNNHRSNLAWASYKENESHKKLHGTRICGEDMPAHKLTEVDVVRVRRLNKIGVNSTELSKVFGVSRQVVSEVLNGTAWKHVPFDQDEARASPCAGGE